MVKHSEFYIKKDEHTKKDAVFFKLLATQLAGAEDLQFDGKADVSHVKNYADAFGNFKVANPHVFVSEDEKIVIGEPVEAPTIVDFPALTDEQEVSDENKEASEVDL